MSSNDSKQDEASKCTFKGCSEALARDCANRMCKAHCLEFRGSSAEAKACARHPKPSSSRPQEGPDFNVTLTSPQRNAGNPQGQSAVPSVADPERSLIPIIEAAVRRVVASEIEKKVKPIKVASASKPAQSQRGPINILESIAREAGLQNVLSEEGDPLQDLQGHGQEGIDDGDGGEDCEDGSELAAAGRGIAAPISSDTQKALERVLRLYGSLRQAMVLHSWTLERNKHEGVVLGHAVDELLLNGVAMTNPGVAVLMRRLSGLLVADSTGNWDLCSIISNECDLPFLMSSAELRSAARVASVMRQVSSRGGARRGGRGRWRARGGSRFNESRAQSLRGGHRGGAGAGAQQP
jgi:hypothetical protein